MGISFVKRADNPQSAALAQVVADATKDKPEKPTRKRTNTNTRPRPMTFSLDIPGVRVRVGHWLWLLDIAAPTFWAWRQAGKVPDADGHDGRPYWLGQTVSAWLSARDNGKQ